MSNVRPRASQMRSMLVHTVAVHRSAAVRGLSLYRLVKRHMRCSGAGRPSFGGQRTVSSCKRFLQHRFGLSVLRRPAHRRFDSENMHRPNGGCSAAVPSLGRRMNRSLSSNSPSRALTREVNTNTNTGLGSHSAVGTGALVAQAAKQVKIRARSVRSHARPNPSVEGTSSSRLRPPPAAPHVKR
jgi:hypothetical protein